MADGWFVLVLIGCIVLGAGMVLAAALMRAAWAQRERETLTAADLRAVEESAVLLIEQLKSQADNAVADLDRRCAALLELMTEADKRVETLREPAPERAMGKPLLGAATVAPAGRADSEQVLQLASNGMTCAEIARLTGLDCAEVKLMLSLGRLRIEG